MTFENLIGRRVHYTGDVCNSPRDGAISRIWESQFGHDAVIKWDEPVMIGWDETGSAVVENEPITHVAPHALVEEAAAKPCDRFRLVARSGKVGLSG